MIVFDPTRAADLALSGTSNNPIIFWDNLSADSGTLTTSIGTEVESAALTATGTTYDAWIATPAGGQVALQLVLPSAQTLNAVAIAAHNIGGIGATVRVEYSTNNGGSWSDSGAGPLSPQDNASIAFYFDDVSASYWRIRVTGAASNNVNLAVAFWGQVLTVPQRLYQGYTSPIVPNIVKLQSNVSQGGNKLGSSVERRSSAVNPTITLLKRSFVRGDEFKGFMRHHNDGKEFFWIWRPTDIPEDTFYGWRQGDTISPPNSGPKAYTSFSMDLRLYDNP